jgi:hypothetical protein
MALVAAMLDDLLGLILVSFLQVDPFVALTGIVLVCFVAKSCLCVLGEIHVVGLDTTFSWFILADFSWFQIC